ncbi:particle associated protein [Yersinia phage fHe-Yen8-01]|nr:particle associated protein [Yersinia phage fHe-Yen8-01]
MKPTGEQVRAARIAAGMKPKQMADRLGYTLRAYQRKESDKSDGTQLTKGEYELMLILAHGEPKNLIAAVDAARDVISVSHASLQNDLEPAFVKAILNLDNALAVCEPACRDQ